jgi:hypothetical protein
MMLNWRLAMMATVWAACGSAGLPAEGITATIPDTRAFLVEVREKLQSDELLLDQYTFTEVLR